MAPMMASIGEILTRKRGRGGVRRGVPRRRESDIRRGLKKRQPRDRIAAEIRRQARQIKASKPKPRDRFIDHLAALGAGPVVCNQSRIAAEIGVNVRTVQEWMAYLVSRGEVRKLDSRGGKGRGVLIEIDQNAIARRRMTAGSHTMIPSQPLLRGSDLHAAAPLALRAERSASRLKSKLAWPPTGSDLRSEYRRLRQSKSRSPRRRRNGWLRLIRRTAGYRGCEIWHSKIVTAAAADAAARIGKGGKRDAYLVAIAIRLRIDPALPPASWPALVEWLAGAPEWFAHWNLRRNAECQSTRIDAAPSRSMGTDATAGSRARLKADCEPLPEPEIRTRSSTCAISRSPLAPTAGSSGRKSQNSSGAVGWSASTRAADAATVSGSVSSLDFGSEHEPQSGFDNPAEPEQRAGAPVARGAARGAQDAAGASGVRPRSQDRQPSAQLALALPPWARRFAEIPLRASSLKQISVQSNPSQIASQILVNSMPGTVPGGQRDGGLDMQHIVSAKLVHATHTNIGYEMDQRKRRDSDDPHRRPAEGRRREDGGGEG